MTEIKFRVWCNQSKRMFYQPILLKNQIGDYEVYVEKEDIEGDGYLLDCNLMQYTGVKDRIGKEIYEGDICEFIVGCSRKIYLEVSEDIKGALVAIEYKNLSYGFIPMYPELCHPDDKDWCSFWRDEEETLWDNEYFKVVGNIYQGLT